MAGSGTRISRLLFLARAMLDPTTQSVAADNIPLTLACDRNGVLWVKDIGAAGGAANPSPGWTETHDPAANTLATCSHINFATPSGSFVVTGLSATLSNNNAAATGILKVRLHSSQTGTDIWTANIQAGPNTGQPTQQITISGLNILFPLGTATWAFSAAGGALTQENVSMTGYDIP